MTVTRKNFWAGLMLMGAALFGLSLITSSIAQNGGSPRGTILTLNGAVTPPVADYLEREIAAASDRKDELVVLEIDTPGGLIDSMKTIVKAIFASDTPVVTYVSPQGARSASAGLYIMYASHVSAMAPATNTGSATPIEVGGGGEPVFAPEDLPEDEETGDDATETPAAAPVDISNEASLRGKIIEDSVAYIRSLAEERGRNAEWAEKAVRPPSASITSNEALELGVIEIVADDLDDLLLQLDGRTVATANGEKVLTTQNVVMVKVEPTLIERILSYVADPNVAAILFSIGTVGVIAEIWNPGSIFPGAIGALSLVLAFYSTQVLPANVLFLALMGLGVILIVTEAFTPTFGIVGVSGLAIFGIGLFFLFPEEFRVSPMVIGSSLVAAGAFLAMIMVAFARSRGHGPLIGQEAIRKREGRVDQWDDKAGEGYVIVDGERWKARSKDNLKPGDRIKVQDVDGIVLVIKRASTASNPISRMIPLGQKKPTADKTLS